MASNGKKGGGYKPSPTVSHFNEDVRSNEIMKVFNDLQDANKTRMEAKSIFDLNTFPSVIPKMKKK